VAEVGPGATGMEAAQVQLLHGKDGRQVEDIDDVVVVGVGSEALGQLADALALAQHEQGEAAPQHVRVAQIEQREALQVVDDLAALVQEHATRVSPEEIMI